MRADLQGTDGSALLVASPDEFRPFISEEDAFRWLQPFAGDPSNVATLRRALAEQFSPIFVGRLRDHEVLRQIARLIARACVAVDLRTIPWTLSGEDPAAGAKEDWETNAELTEMAEEEAEFEDIKPEPIIPPEFPRMAKREASQIDLSAKIMGGLLDLLRWIGERLLPGSKVGEALIGLANSHAIAVEEEAGNFAGEMAALAGNDGGRPEPSVVASTLQREANGTAESVILAADRTGDLIAGLLAGPATGVGPSAVAQKMKDEAGSQGRGIVEKAGDTAALVDTLLKPSPQPKLPPSEVGAMFKDAASEQADGLQAATDRAKDAVGGIDITPPAGEPPEPSGTGTALIMESAVAGESMSNAAAEASKTLDELAATPEKVKPPKPKTTVKLVADPGIELANLTVRVQVGGEEKLLRTDASGMIELDGVPEAGFDILGIEDSMGLEVAGVVEEKAGSPPPPPPTAAPKAAEPAAAAPPAAEPAAAEPKATEPASGIERPLFPEEEAWLAHVNRTRKARGLPQKTRDDIPPEITAKAEERRERRARRKKKRS